MTYGNRYFTFARYSGWCFFTFLCNQGCLLLFREELVDRFRNKTKWLDIVLGSLIVVTGFYLLFIQPQILMWMIIKIVIVFASIPLGIIAMKRKSKGWLFYH